MHKAHEEKNGEKEDGEGEKGKGAIRHLEICVKNLF